MKALWPLILITTFVACNGGGGSGGSSSGGSKPGDNEERTQLVLHAQSFSESTLNGDRVLRFTNEKSGSIKLLLNYNKYVEPLMLMNPIGVEAEFFFEEHASIEKDIIELRNISRIEAYQVTNCPTCNTEESLSTVKQLIAKRYAKLLTNKDSIIVKVEKKNNNAQFVLMRLADFRISL